MTRNPSGLREMHSSMEMQQQMEAGERLMEMPSFRSISGSQQWPLFLLGHQSHEGETGSNNGSSSGGDGSDEEDFEFASVSRDSLDGFEEPVSAHEIFSDGRIRAVYPLFAPTFQFHAPAAVEAEKPIDLSLSFRDFLVGDGRPLSTSSSASSASSESSNDLDGVPPESDCAWAPPASPDLRKKSHSTGAASAASKKWRLRDLVAGRSHSDGKQRFVCVAAPRSSAAGAKEKKDKKKGQQPPRMVAASGEEKKGKVKGRGGGKMVTEMDMAAAHRIYYLKGGAAAENRRRSFLPYRKDLLGLFATVNVAGLSF